MHRPDDTRIVVAVLIALFAVLRSVSWLVE